MKVYLPESGTIYVNRFNKTIKAVTEVTCTWNSYEELNGVIKLVSKLRDNGALNEIPTRHNKYITLAINENGWAVENILITLDELLNKGGI